MTIDWNDNFSILYKKKGQQRYGIRLRALMLRQNGATLSKISESIEKTVKTIRSWIWKYESGGLNKLLTINTGRGRKAKIKDRKVIEDMLCELHNQNGGRPIGKDMIRYLENRFKIKYSLSGLYTLLHRHKYSWVTSRSIHPKANIEEQDTFKKTLNQK